MNISKETLEKKGYEPIGEQTGNYITMARDNMGVLYDRKSEIQPNPRDLVTICNEIAQRYTITGLVTPVMIRYLELRRTEGYNHNRAIGELYRAYSAEYAQRTGERYETNK